MPKAVPLSLRNSLPHLGIGMAKAGTKSRLYSKEVPVKMEKIRVRLLPFIPQSKY